MNKNLIQLKKVIRHDKALLLAFNELMDNLYISIGNNNTYKDFSSLADLLERSFELRQFIKYNHMKNRNMNFSWKY